MNKSRKHACYSVGLPSRSAQQTDLVYLIISCTDSAACTVCQTDCRAMRWVLTDWRVMMPILHWMNLCHIHSPTYCLARCMHAKSKDKTRVWPMPIYLHSTRSMYKKKVHPCRFYMNNFIWNSHKEHPRKWEIQLEKTNSSYLICVLSCVSPPSLITTHMNKTPRN